MKIQDNNRAISPTKISKKIVLIIAIKNNLVKYKINCNTMKISTKVYLT